MSFAVIHLISMLLLLAFSFTFGVTLKLSDLLQEHGYTWFKGALLVTATVCAALGVAMLHYGDPYLHLLWMGVLGSWVLRGRIDGWNHALMAVAMSLYLAFAGPGLAYDPAVLAYFGLSFLVLGGVHDLLQYSKVRAPKAVEWFFAQQHIYWYLLTAGFCVFFEIDQALVLCVYGFVKGYGLLYDEGRLTRLRSWGIKKRPGAA